MARAKYRVIRHEDPGDSPDKVRIYYTIQRRRLFMWRDLKVPEDLSFKCPNVYPSTIMRVPEFATEIAATDFLRNYIWAHFRRKPVREVFAEYDKDGFTT